MPTYPHIDSYYEQLHELIEFGGATNEENIRLAFLNCLSDYCKEHSERFVLVPELRSDRSNKPDGTVRDSLRMTRGLWEAKDTHDDLDREIQNKLGQGYSGDNILFENSQTAVLVQGDQEVLRTNMANAAALDELIRRFLDYELPEIQEFRDARQQFKDDLPAVLESLRATIVDAEASNPSYQEGARIFLELCHQSISPNVTNDNVREMLIQHILTKDIFLRVFGEDQFHRENNVARQLDALEGTFFTGNVRRQAIDRLRAYYGAIGRAADDIAEYSEKQQFLKGIYEDFYQAYNPGAADRLGVVYTPNEVVDFIIRGTDWLLQKHFGKTLADKNVNILDPATGTGTFITNLMNHMPADRLQYKYLNEIHANEVEILPYYIANLNIEFTFKELTGDYLGFPNPVLCGHAGQHGLERSQRRYGAATDDDEPRGCLRRKLDPRPGAEREAHQRHHRQPAVQREPAERKRQQQKSGVPGDRPSHPRDLHQGEYGAEDEAVRYVQAVHPVGVGSPRGRWDCRVHHQPGLLGNASGRRIQAGGGTGVHGHLRIRFGFGRPAQSENLWHRAQRVWHPDRSGHRFLCP